MTSPACTVSDNGGGAVPTINGVDVADDGTDVTIALADVGGVRVWGIEIASTDDMVVAPALTIDPVGKTATFTKPAGPWALIFQSQVNGGLNIDNDVDPTYTTTFGIFCKTAGLRLAAANEETEGSAAFGWTTKFNALTRAVASGGGGGGGNATWQTGTDTNMTISGTSGQQIVVVPTLTAARTWKMPSSPTDGMQVGIYDLSGVLVDSGDTLSLTTTGGTDHFFFDGADKGTTWQIPASLYKNGTVNLVRRAGTNSWNVAL